jgi:hypothetical protein
MRLPIFYPTVDGGWREVWVDSETSLTFLIEEITKRKQNFEEVE